MVNRKPYSKDFILLNHYNTSGILRDKTMTDKLTNFPNLDTQINSSVDYNHWFKRLDTQLKSQPNQIR